jgi:hypothetical protein
LPGADHAIRVLDVAPRLEAPVAAATEPSAWRRLAVPLALVFGLGLVAAAAIYAVRRRRARPAAAPPAEALAVFPCGLCDKSLKVKATLVGRKVKCPGCGAVTEVPRSQTRKP